MDSACHGNRMRLRDKTAYVRSLFLADIAGNSIHHSCARRDRVYFGGDV